MKISRRALLLGSAALPLFAPAYPAFGATAIVRRPTAPPRVNWKNPLAAGLVGVYVGAEAGSPLYDLSGSGCNLQVATGGVFRPTQEGFAFDSSSGGAWCTSATPAQQPASQATIFWRGQLTATPTGNVMLFGCRFQNGSSTPFVAWDIEVNSSGDVTGNCDDGTGLVSATGTAPGNGVLFDAAVTADVTGGASGGIFLYQNGINTASSGATAGTFDYGTNPNLGIADGSTTSTPARTLIAYCWANRVLSAAEILSLHYDPYQLLETETP